MMQRCMTKQSLPRVCLFLYATNAHTCKYQQPRGQPSVPYVSSAASSGDPAKAVVAVAAVLGSEIAAVLVTAKLSTGGTRACRPAKHGHSSR